MKRLFFPLFAGLLWLMSGTLSATERTYNVLFIQSYTKNTPWHSLLTENLENGLDKGGVKANITTEYLNADYWSFASECFIMRRICERARQRKTDFPFGWQALLLRCRQKGNPLPYSRSFHTGCRDRSSSPPAGNGTVRQEW